MVFKDRDKYVSGEYRFRNGYCKYGFSSYHFNYIEFTCIISIFKHRSNPRKMVKTWAEKEMRNLKRLQSAGIRCPVPHLLKQHVLIMDFLGKDGFGKINIHIYYFYYVFSKFIKHWFYNYIQQLVCSAAERKTAKYGWTGRVLPRSVYGYAANVPRVQPCARRLKWVQHPMARRTTSYYRRQSICRAWGELTLYCNVFYNNLLSPLNSIHLPVSFWGKMWVMSLNSSLKEELPQFFRKQSCFILWWTNC